MARSRAVFKRKQQVLEDPPKSIPLPDTLSFPGSLIRHGFTPVFKSGMK